MRSFGYLCVALATTLLESGTFATTLKDAHPYLRSLSDKTKDNSRNLTVDEGNEALEERVNIGELVPEAKDMHIIDMDKLDQNVIVGEALKAKFDKHTIEGIGKYAATEHEGDASNKMLEAKNTHTIDMDKLDKEIIVGEPLKAKFDKHTHEGIEKYAATDQVAEFLRKIKPETDPKPLLSRIWQAVLVKFRAKTADGPVDAHN